MDAQRIGMLARKKRGDAAAMFFTSLLSASWLLLLLLLVCAVTRASSQPDDPVISPKPIADVLLEPPAHTSEMNTILCEFDVKLIGC